MSPHEVREGRNTIFIGIDESYDTNIDGNFVLNSFIIFSEKEMESISNLVKNYLAKNNKEEIKYDKTSKANVRKIIKEVMKYNFLNLYNKTEIKTMSSILQINYKGALITLCKYLQSNYSDRKINIKIDIIAGEKFQKECLKIIRNVIKNKYVKVKFINSKSDPLIQISDLFAAINRLDNKHKVIDNILNKNKSL